MAFRGAHPLPLLLVGLLAACAPRLSVHSSWPASGPHADHTPAAMWLAQLQATGRWYRWKQERNHHKPRFMAALGAAMAGTTAGLAVATADPGTSTDVDRVLAGFAASTGGFGMVLSLVPFAHGYADQERCYKAAADEAEAAYAAWATRCGAVEPVPEACMAELAMAVARAHRFPPDSPCRPPPESWLDRAVGPTRRPPGTPP